MGFKDVRALLVDALQTNQFATEMRPDIDRKNLLAVKEVTPVFVARLLLRCRGGDYETQRHHLYPDVPCHVFTPVLDGEGWYVKAYFVSARAVFISVHRS